MVKDNGRDPRDPEYDDYGFSDFETDYIPEDHQLLEFLEEHPDQILKMLTEEYGTSALHDLQDLWKQVNREEIENEWDSRGEE